MSDAEFNPAQDQVHPVGRAAHLEPKHPPIKSIEDVIVFKLSRLVGVNERAGARWSEQLFDLSINEWRLLGLIQAHAPIRAGDLAELMLMDKSQLSRLVKSLSVKKLLISKPDPEDARAVMLKLTAQGQELFKKVITEALLRNEHVLSPLSAQEVLAFDEMLDRLIAHNLSILAKPAR